MNLYFAPLEGITTCYYRRLHHRLFGGVDRYYTPFISIYPDHSIKKRDEREINPAINEGMNVVPQILSNDAGDFCFLFKRLVSMGYEEVNLNLGCPSGTVTAKGRGSGFLRDLDALDDFFQEVFDTLGDEALRLSVKTRIGVNDASEMEAISELYARYPIKELIIHPRVRKQFYKGIPDLNAFSKAFEASTCPVCYNGDIFSVRDYDNIVQRFDDQKLQSIMLGRGIIANPALGRQIKGGAPLDKAEFRAFRKELEATYKRELSSEHNVFSKMKEMWFYMGNTYENSDKYVKAILKSKTYAEYSAAANTLEGHCSLKIR